MAKMLKQPEKAPKKFDINRPYKWEPDDIFQMTGQQFAMIYHALNQMVVNKEGASIAQIYEAYQVMIELFKEGVEQGVIVESTQAESIEENDDKQIKQLFK